MTPRRPKPSPALTGHVRIIGGRLRGSRLPVPAVAGLRPTSDRVRETLFNWLMFELAGRRVLDLFAGSGALGFEAASRGATRVLMVERDPIGLACLRESAARLAPEVEVRAGDALALLAQPPVERWDVVFLDPPFSADLHAACLTALPAHLAERAWVYVEAPIGLALSLPPGWRLHRELSTREACGRLYRVDTVAGPQPAAEV